MAKRMSTHRVKKHRLYSYEEAGAALCVTPRTVRSWRASGLQVMTSHVPHYILGAELIRYLEEKRTKKSAKMSNEEMFCFTCKAPQKPLWGMVDYIPITDVRGRFKGLCEACEGDLQRFVGRRDLGKFGQFYDIAFKDGS